MAKRIGLGLPTPRAPRIEPKPMVKVDPNNGPRTPVGPAPDVLQKPPSKPFNGGEKNGS